MPSSQHLLHFFQLKKDLGDNYEGGILIIDEIEAGLHPKTQLKLIRKIQKQAKDLKWQVIAITHSLTVIKEVLEATENKSKSSKIMDSVAYLMDTRLPKIMPEPNYTKIKSDMLLIEINQEEALKVYFEDDEAKYFFEKILKNRGCSRLALNFTPFSQGFKLHFRCPKVKPKFTFLQE